LIWKVRVFYGTCRTRRQRDGRDAGRPHDLRRTRRPRSRFAPTGMTVPLDTPLVTSCAHPTHRAILLCAASPHVFGARSCARFGSVVRGTSWPTRLEHCIDCPRWHGWIRRGCTGLRWVCCKWTQRPSSRASRIIAYASRVCL
jgi:hypothetical protein